MLFSKPQIKILSGFKDIELLGQALEEKIGKPPFQNYVLDKKGEHWFFRFQLARFKPFGNNSRSLKIHFQQLDNGDLELSIREAFDGIIPVMVLSLIMVGLFYGFSTTNWGLTGLVLIFGVAVWYYNTRLHGGLIQVFLNLLEEVADEKA